MYAYHPETRAARDEATRLGLPEAGYQAFRSQQYSAKRRGIPFLFSMGEWWAWWQREGRWARRGRKASDLVMARRGDAGPYSPENVYCTTSTGNMKDIPQKARAAATLKRIQTRRANGCPLGAHLKVRGDGHPKSKPVLTPRGRFGSASLAAEAFRISRQYARVASAFVV